MSFDLEALENVIVTTPTNARAEPPEQEATPEPQTDEPEQDAPELVEFTTEAVFLDQWGMIHMMIGGLMQARVGAPCDLASVAQNEGGLVAGKAVYALLMSNPAMKNLVLSTKSTFMGQVAAIGMHGFACVQVVKAARNEAIDVEFKRHPDEVET